MTTNFIDDQHRDLNENLFPPVAAGFLIAVVGRMVIALCSGVPIQEMYIAFYSAWCGVLLVASSKLSRYGFVEASLVTKGLFLLVASMPFAQDMLFAGIHFGRRFPYQDSLLYSWDSTLGFDWKSYADWFDRTPAAWLFSLIAYDFIFAQVPLAIFALSYSRQTARLYTFLAASAVSLALCCLVVAFFPALGAYAYFGGVAAGFEHRDFITGDGMTAAIEWLRQETPIGTMSDIGLISFPSYHAVCAVSGIWAFWRIPYLRWVTTLLNAAMLVVTPVQGSHYLVDILAGTAVAGLSLIACKSLVLLAKKYTNPKPFPPFDDARGTATAYSR